MSSSKSCPAYLQFMMRKPGLRLARSQVKGEDFFLFYGENYRSFSWVYSGLINDLWRKKEL